MVMREKALRFLEAMGISEIENDTIFDFIVQAVTESLCNRTNQSEVPEGLTMVGVYRIVGQYLRMKKNSGQLTGLNGAEFDGAIKQIQEGDTSITFGVGDAELTPEARLESLISWLLSYGEEQLYRYRRLVW